MKYFVLNLDSPVNYESYALETPFSSVRRAAADAASRATPPSPMSVHRRRSKWRTSAAAPLAVWRRSWTMMTIFTMVAELALCVAKHWVRWSVSYLCGL